MKRVLSALLCLCLCFSLVPGTLAQAPAAEEAAAAPELDELAWTVGNGEEEESAEAAANAAKPAITSQSESKSVKEDETAKFKVNATGSSLKYQWQYRTSSSGSWASWWPDDAKTELISVKAIAARSGYQFRCKVTNGGGTVYSKAMTLTVLKKPVVTSQSESKTVKEDTTVSFKVNVSGSGLKYQWQYRKAGASAWSDSTASGATTNTISVKATAGRNGCQYRCKVTNSGGTIYSKVMTLNVLTKPVITSQSASKTAAQDATVKFKVNATGDSLKYQWQYRKAGATSWTDSTASGARTSTITVTATAGRDGCQYRCKVTSSGGTVYSKVITLTVQVKPTITSQSASKTAKQDTIVKLKVNAEGEKLK